MDRIDIDISTEVNAATEAALAELPADLSRRLSHGAPSVALLDALGATSGADAFLDLMRRRGGLYATSLRSERVLRTLFAAALIERARHTSEVDRLADAVFSRSVVDRVVTHIVDEPGTAAEVLDGLDGGAVSAIAAGLFLTHADDGDLPLPAMLLNETLWYLTTAVRHGRLIRRLSPVFSDNSTELPDV